MQAETITALQLFESGLSKGAIASMAKNAVESVLESGNVLQVAEAISAMSEFVEAVKKDPRFRDYVREEAGKHPKGFIANSGAKIECAEVGSRYDYSQCNDPLFEKYLQESDDANNQLKVHQDFLKTIPADGIEVVRDDEVVRIFPPSKASTSSFKVTLAK